MAQLKGLGCLFACQFSAPTYTTIAQRAEISGPNRIVETIDVTNLDSSAREHIPTIPDSGEITVSFQFDPDNSTHNSLETLMGTPAQKSFRLTFTDSTPTTYTFTGTLTNFDVSGITVDGVVMADCTVKISGAITKA